MWQAIALQCLSCGVVAASLYAKSTPDFDQPVTAGLMIASLIISALSIKTYKDQEQDTKKIRRNIDNLIRSVVPNEYVSESVIVRLSKSAPKGFELCKVNKFDDGLNFITFYSESKNCGGIVIIERKDMCEFALVDENELTKSVRQYMMDDLGQDDFWNSLVHELSLAARYVVEDRALPYPMFNRVWANATDREIGIAISEKASKPDLILNHDEQMRIIKMPRMKRHFYLVNRIEVQLKELMP